MSYADFIARKYAAVPAMGIDRAIATTGLKPHQHMLAQWALRRGRAAIFADTGLGKTRMQLAWANAVAEHTGRDVLILAPLAVAQQTAEEGLQVGVKVNHARSDADLKSGVNITNYDRLHLFDSERFSGVVLDESSIIKHHTTKTLAQLIEAFERTPYKLCATATPAPNDWTELGTHAEFLGVCSRTEMLAEYFIHDAAKTQDWRLKGHARDLFWRWVAQWGAMVRKPSDLGFDDAGYDLPPLEYHEHIITTGNRDFELFPTEASDLSARRSARRDSIGDRVAECVSMVNGDDQPWVVWCDLNDESDMLAAGIHGAVEVRGSMDIDQKESALAGFASGKHRVIVTKPSISGWGLNWQHSARVAFVGVTDSWESYYQAVRRCWRFGQTRPVQVHVFATDREGSVLANLMRKERAAKAMSDELSIHTRQHVIDAIGATQRQSNEYKANKKMEVPAWLKTA